MKSFAIVLLFTLAAASSFLRVNPNSVTVSGISSGAFFAVQYHIAFSSLIRGAGIVAGGPFGCSGGSMMGAESCLFNPSGINVASLVKNVKSLAQQGRLDPLSNLANQTLHLWSGTGDTVVPQATMKALVKMYQALGATQYLTKNFESNAEHSWVTDMYGNSCTYLGSPYVNNCGYDFAGTFLERAFTNMGIDWETSKVAINRTNMYQFNQVRYGADPEVNSMGDIGYLYVPASCMNNKTCHLHINFHGCEQGHTYIGDTYVTETELNEWAETNSIILLYPQVTNNGNNPSGCWDWWGYDDAGYDTKTGTQMGIIHHIVAQMLEGTFPAPSHHDPTNAPGSPPGPTGAPTCAGKSMGTTCLSTSSYIACPAGLVFNCSPGTTCTQIAPGAGACL